MNHRKKRALQAAGWKFGDAGDFLGMSDEERALLDARVQAATAIRSQRRLTGMTQVELASKLKTSQPRIAKIERAAADVSLDQMLRALAAAGGTIAVKQQVTARQVKYLTMLGLGSTPDQKGQASIKKRSRKASA
jgi:transcriptional regulator with XRE-family HTH domain